MRIKEILSHAGLRRYGANAAWLMGEKILRMAVGVFVGIWIARYLGPEQFGLFSYAQSLVMLFGIVASLGLDGIVIRELVNSDESRKNVLLGTAWGLKFIAGIAVIVILAFTVYFISKDRYTETLVLIIAGATIFQSFNIIDCYFQAKVLSRYVVFANTLTLILSSVIKVAMIIWKAPLIAFAWMVVFDSMVSAAGLVYFYLQNNPSISTWKFDKQRAVELLKESWPLILVGMASVINMRMDQVLLANMTNFTVVGNYAAAVRVSELWLVLPGILGSSIYPAIISAKNSSESLYRNRLFTVTKYMALFTIPFAIVVSLFSSEIIKVLYGVQFPDAALYLSLYIWTGVPFLIFFVFSQAFLIERLTKYNFYITVYAVTVNIALNLILIPRFGGIGAVIGTLIVAYGAQLISIGIIYKKTRIFSREKI